MISARISVAPSGALDASHVPWYGAVVSLATAVKVPEPKSLTCHSTCATPEPETSVAVAARATAAPPTMAPLVGVVTLPVGLVRSTRTTRGALVETLPPASVATAISSHCCSAAGGVDQVVVKGAVASEPISVPAAPLPTVR